jgi:YD repeat-containing protein
VNSGGRPVSRNAGGQATTFTYTAAGQPLRTTQPDGSWIERQYDRPSLSAYGPA